MFRRTALLLVSLTLTLQLAALVQQM